MFRSLCEEGAGKDPLSGLRGEFQSAPGATEGGPWVARVVRPPGSAEARERKPIPAGGEAAMAPQKGVGGVLAAPALCDGRAQLSACNKEG